MPERLEWHLLCSVSAAWQLPTRKLPCCEQEQSFGRLSGRPRWQQIEGMLHFWHAAVTCWMEQVSWHERHFLSAHSPDRVGKLMFCALPVRHQSSFLGSCRLSVPCVCWTALWLCLMPSPAWSPSQRLSGARWVGVCVVLRCVLVICSWCLNGAQHEIAWHSCGLALKACVTQHETLVAQQDKLQQRDSWHLKGSLGCRHQQNVGCNQYFL